MRAAAGRGRAWGCGGWLHTYTVPVTAVRRRPTRAEAWHALRGPRDAMTAPWMTHQPSYPGSILDFSMTTALQYGNITCGNDESFKFQAYTITYCIVFPVGLLCNSLAFYVFLCLTPKTSVNRVFNMNLALSDVGFSVTLPFRLIYYLRGGHWDFPDWLCRWCVFSFYLNLYTSVLFLTSLSVLRYLAVLYPIRNRSLVTVRRAQCICLAIWLFVALSSTPFFLSGTVQGHKRVHCFEPGGPVSWRRIFALNYVALTFGFLLPFLTILSCYSCIIQRLMVRRMVAKQQLLNRRRAVHVMAVILLTFLLCFLPYHVVRSAHLHAVVALPAGHPRRCEIVEFLQKILVVTLCLAASNSCFNPLLYYFSGQTFRNTVRNSSRRGSRGSLSSFKQGSLLQRRVKSRGHGFMSPVNSDSYPCNPAQENNAILDRAEDL